MTTGQLVDSSGLTAERAIAALPFAPQDGIAAEESWQDAYLPGASSLPELHLWRQSQCVVTTQPIARSAAFNWASERSLARGWPVAIRRSGGGTVFHGAGVLCVSLLEHLPSARVSLDFAYQLLCTTLIEGLRSVGVPAEVGPMPTAPCDGRYNILANGRKLAGTAARMRFHRSGAVGLMHAALVVNGDQSSGVEAVQRFEADLGHDGEYPADCMTSVADLAGPVSVERAASAIRAAFTTHILTKSRIDQ